MAKTLDPIYLFNGEQVGPSPAQVKKTIQWLGKLKQALLVVQFGGKFGWQLEKVQLNGKVYDPKVIQQFDTVKKPNDLYVHVADVLVNGDNTLTVHYSHPFTAHFGDRTTLTAYLLLTIDEIAPGIENPLGTINIPSLDLIVEDIDKRLANATLPTIAILAVIAIIAIAVAVIFSRATGIIGAIKA